ncbi:MAG: 50S ribosomal protein L10 [Acidimicrobiia bacterium]|jgi:large subunit ribosomal protein L10|nr:50S ribosomal protein L10 [Acidimicrobiia bacterium]MBP8180808.1 50S ribosomal protein L10 [Acidimicrobiia bacterium]
MPTAAKVATVEEIGTNLDAATAVIAAEYRGLTVAQLAELRGSLRSSDTAYRIYKNTLVRRAVAGREVEGLEDMLTGPTGLAFVEGDIVEAAKALSAFAKAQPLFVLKGGVLRNKAISAGDVDALSKLDSREVLLAKIAGGFKAPMAKAAGLFAANQRKFAGLLSAYATKREEEEAA